MIDTILLIIAVFFFIPYFTWGMYLGAMNLIAKKQQLVWQTKVFAYPFVGFGLIMDALTNIFVGTLLFIELPSIQQLLLTARLQKHLDEMDAYFDAVDRKENVTPPTKLQKWRWDLAEWVCTNLLDPFDSRGFHCRNPKEINNGKNGGGK